MPAVHAYHLRLAAFCALRADGRFAYWLDCVTSNTSRVCLKIHSCNLHAPLCGKFVPKSVSVARYASWFWNKFPTNCDAHLAESNFQTRSSGIVWLLFELFISKKFFCVSVVVLLYGCT